MILLKHAATRFVRCKHKPSKYKKQNKILKNLKNKE
jgi:hypothetical protein